MLPPFHSDAPRTCGPCSLVLVLLGSNNCLARRPPCGLVDLVDPRRVAQIVHRCRRDCGSLLSWRWQSLTRRELRAPRPTSTAAPSPSVSPRWPLGRPVAPLEVVPLHRRSPSGGRAVACCPARACGRARAAGRAGPQAVMEAAAMRRPGWAWPPSCGGAACAYRGRQPLGLTNRCWLRSPGGCALPSPLPGEEGPRYRSPGGRCRPGDGPRRPRGRASASAQRNVCVGVRRVPRRAVDQPGRARGVRGCPLSCAARGRRARSARSLPARRRTMTCGGTSPTSARPCCARPRHRAGRRFDLRDRRPRAAGGPDPLPVRDRRPPDGQGRYMERAGPRSSIPDSELTAARWARRSGTCSPTAVAWPRWPGPQPRRPLAQRSQAARWTSRGEVAAAARRRGEPTVASAARPTASRSRAVRDGLGHRSRAGRPAP